MKNKYIKFIFLIVFIAFICSYAIANTGYYEQSIRRKTIITNEKIKEFEKALKENKDISEMDFSNKDINYTNRFSRFVYNINDKGNDILRKFLKNVLKSIGKYMLEE